MKYKKYIENILGRSLTDFEAHLFTATYSEHCGYLHSRKMLKVLPREGAIFYDENAGGFEVGNHSILFKMESHNHPCAVEPYNGAATGIGGIVRDVLAMNARPIALCNSLKFGDTIGIKNGVVHGISDYGNCIGVPTVSTEVLYNEAFTENPLVNVAAIGIAKTDEIFTSSCAKPGQVLILVGSHTMRDGLGGAAFASKHLSDEKNQDRLSIQIANPFMKKKLIEACLEIFDKKLVIACQDCGAAGLLSSSSEIAYKSSCGVEIELSNVHIGDTTIKPYEIMLSETQERMLFVTENTHITEIGRILDYYEVPYSVIGKTIESPCYVVKSNGNQLSNLPVKLLVEPPEIDIDLTEANTPPKVELIDINSPEIYEQYDHTVGARTQLNPLDNPNFNSLWLYEENVNLGIYTFSAQVGEVYSSLINAAKFFFENGYTPKGITNCLNFTNPEIPPTMFQFKSAINDIKCACEELKIPVCSGNVSFYNESSTSKICNLVSFVMLGIKNI